MDSINWYAAIPTLFLAAINVALSVVIFRVSRRTKTVEALESAVSGWQEEAGAQKARADRLREDVNTLSKEHEECRSRIVALEAKTDLEQFERRMLERFSAIERNALQHAQSDDAAARAVEGKFVEIKEDLAEMLPLLKTVNESIRGRD